MWVLYVLVPRKKINLVSLSSTFYIKVLGMDRQIATKEHYSWAPRLIVFASRIPPRLLRIRGLVVKSCAVPVWKLSFGSILGHCLILDPSLERIWVAFGSASGVSLGAEPPERGQ